MSGKPIRNSSLLSTSDPLFSKLYIVGDSIFDAGAINTLTFGTSIGDYSVFGYSYRTNIQDVDGDGVEDGEPYAQQLVTVLGLADEVQNEAVAGAEAARDFTFEQHISQDSIFGVSILDVLDYQGRTPPPESLETRMDLAGQVERTLASFEADGSPENAAVILTVGSNDFISFLSSNIAFINENAATLAAVASAGPLDIQALIANPDTPGPLKDFLIELVTTLNATVQATVTAINAFVEAGIDTVIFANNPSYFTPLVQIAPGLPEGFAEVMKPFALAIFGAQNALVEAAIAALDADPSIDTNFEVIDAFSMVEQIFKDPSSFGILNLSQPVYLDTPIGADFGTGPFFLAPANPLYPDGVTLDQSVYFDSVHFTANTHDILTAYSAAALTHKLQFLTDDADAFRSDEPPGAHSGNEDVVFADLGDDRVFVGGGDDVAFGGGGDDKLWGESGDDILAGGSGDDRLYGGKGADVLSGQDGDDLMVGGGGADFLFDGLRSDVANGGAGDDVFLNVAEELIGGAPGNDDIDLFIGGGGFDTLLLVIADEAARDAAIAAIEASRDADGRLSDFAVAELGIEAEGVERVVIFDHLVLPNNATTDPDLGETIAWADLWGVIPPAEGGTGLADAAYDSDFDGAIA